MIDMQDIKILIPFWMADEYHIKNPHNQGSSDGSFISDFNRKWVSEENTKSILVSNSLCGEILPARQSVTERVSEDELCRDCIVKATEQDLRITDFIE